MLGKRSRRQNILNKKTCFGLQGSEVLKRQNPSFPKDRNGSLTKGAETPQKRFAASASDSSPTTM
ncbi:hypothetical protein J6590_040107 [Homalodisca vitripennis]|nr:hypothetical protein J6590_040107 [Homalodisca vitripennis]